MNRSVRSLKSDGRPARDAQNKEGNPIWVALFLVFGAPGRIRTSYPLVRSQVLYPDELRALSKEARFYQQFSLRQAFFKAFLLLAERGGFEPPCQVSLTIRFRVGAVMTASVPLRFPACAAFPGGRIIRTSSANCTSPACLVALRPSWWPWRYAAAVPRRRVPPRRHTSRSDRRPCRHTRSGFP
jgi:hypothetical protein